jgi:hypothetical protein
VVLYQRSDESHGVGKRAGAGSFGLLLLFGWALPSGKRPGQSGSIELAHDATWTRAQLAASTPLRCFSETRRSKRPQQIFRALLRDHSNITTGLTFPIRASLPFL